MADAEKKITISGHDLKVEDEIRCVDRCDIQPFDVEGVVMAVINQFTGRIAVRTEAGTIVSTFLNPA